MATTYAILGQQAPSSTTAAALITNVSGHSYIVSTVVVCNTGTAAVPCSIFAAKAGSGTAAGQSIVSGSSIPANSTVTFTLGITLNATNGDTLSVQIPSGSTFTLTFTAFGSDIV